MTWALDRPDEKVMPVPALVWSRTGEALAWAKVRAGVTLTPVPPAPAVPTEVMVRVSRIAPLSIVSVSPTARLATLATRRLVAPTRVADERVVAMPAVPTAVIVRDSSAPAVSTRTCWPTVKPVTLGTLTLVSPMLAAENRVVAAPAAVPTAVIVRLSRFAAVSTLRLSLTARPATLARYTVVSPIADGATRDVAVLFEVRTGT